ncbi:MAG TPA: 2-amino-4-hydroxy-6-hydroxymethyldihydropteridine diphosphokinase [Candidatus Acidoferrales bacterium]|nr:2-amino-4-hydroxy-6-hydroxymethyldihydropteridine diphosphokinase [Candidatus Acidoferrales bacterium]
MAAAKIVYFSLGSNLGDRAAQLARAIDALAGAGVRLRRQSSLYLTEPVGGIRQRAFLNTALEGETRLMPLELLHAVWRIERALGRRRMVPLGPRAIDIDILFFGTSVVRMPELEVPHPRIAGRRFVLVPLNEIAPELRHPALHRSIAELLAATRDRSIVRQWHPASA